VFGHFCVLRVAMMHGHAARGARRTTRGAHVTLEAGTRRAAPFAVAAPRARRWETVNRSSVQHVALNGQASFINPGRRRFSSAMDEPGSEGPLQRYRTLCATGEITHDDNQDIVVSLLDDVCWKIANYAPNGNNCVKRVAAPVAKGAAPSKPSTSAPSNGGIFGGFFGGGGDRAAKAKPKPKVPVEPLRMLPLGPKGLYVWGGCGTGKTFLMDLFYNSVPVKQKQRIHFHEWMIDVHERLHRLQKKNAAVTEKANTVWTAEAAKAQREQLQKNAAADKDASSANDLVMQVANEMLAEGWLLCFDEFQVTHISDAIIMKRLFSILFEKGAVIIATSNRPPKDLYLNGLNRPLFTPFIPMLQDFCDVHDIASGHDYRLATTGEDEDKRTYIFPNGNEEAKLLERKFYRLAKREVQTGQRVEAQGRSIVVPKCAVDSNIAWFRFKDLCDKPLGAGDYLAIASQFHTVFIADIPLLTMQERDQVRRFITMIDAFYEKKVKLIVTADDDAKTLLRVTEDEKTNSTFDEIFAWDRTVSRLIEMQSVKYIDNIARTISGEQFLGQFDLQSLDNDDVGELWRRYDTDDDGDLDKRELRVMFEDLLELQMGHRNISDAVEEACILAVDKDQDGLVSRDDLELFFTDSPFAKTNFNPTVIAKSVGQ